MLSVFYPLLLLSIASQSQVCSWFQFWRLILYFLGIPDKTSSILSNSSGAILSLISYSLLYYFALVVHNPKCIYFQFQLGGSAPFWQEKYLHECVLCVCITCTETKMLLKAFAILSGISNSWTTVGSGDLKLTEAGCQHWQDKPGLGTWKDSICPSLITNTEQDPLTPAGQAEAVLASF